MAKDFSISAKFKGIDALSGVTSKITTNLNKVVAVGTKINNKFKTVNKTVKSVANNVKRASVGAVLGLTAILAPAIAFSAQINELEAVSRATEKQMASLTVQAKELGSTTKFSASQAASAQTFLARASFKVNEIIAATPATLDLASAANMELARTADIASNIMGGFQLPANQMVDVANVLAATTSSANVNLEELGESLKIAAPIALKANVSLRETAAVVGLLGNAGIKGTLAGTAFRRMMSSLIAPTSKAGKLIKALKVETTDANNKIKSTPKILVDIAKALKGLPEPVQFQTLNEIFGIQSLSAALNLVDKAASGELADLATSLDLVDNRAKDMAETMNKGALGAINNLKSASEGLAIQIAEGGLLGKFTKIVSKLTVFIRSLTGAEQGTLTAITTVLLLTAALAPVLISLSVLITVMGTLASVSAVVGVALHASVIKPLLTTGLAVLGNIAKMLGLQAVYVATAAQAVIFGTAIKTSIIASLRAAGVALVAFVAQSAAFGVLSAGAVAVGTAIKAALLPPLLKTLFTMMLIATVNPLTPIILGIGVLIGLGVLLVKNWQVIKTFFKDLGQSILGFFMPVIEIFSAISDIAGKFFDAFQDEEINVKANIHPVSVSPDLEGAPNARDQFDRGRFNSAPEAAASAPALFAGNQAAVAQQNGSANARATIEFLNANENIVGRDDEGQQIDLNNGLTAAMGF